MYMMSDPIDENDPQVPCKWCGRATRMLGTELCDVCWELETRIKANPKLAVKIIEHYYNPHRNTNTMRTFFMYLICGILLAVIFLGAI